MNRFERRMRQAQRRDAFRAGGGKMTGETYATGKPFPPRSEWVPRLFRRADCFYVIDLPEDDDLAEHARLNPGTLRIEDAGGNQLWPPKLEIVG